MIEVEERATGWFWSDPELLLYQSPDWNGPFSTREGAVANAREIHLSLDEGRIE
jgi:hypothetical protein